jgi:hypothetical protein
MERRIHARNREVTIPAGGSRFGDAGEEKLVRGLGERGPVPVEVIPFAQGLATTKLRALWLIPADGSTSSDEIDPRLPPGTRLG